MTKASCILGTGSSFEERLPVYLEEASKVLEEAKKLTKETRDKLKDSVFCGPGRSFPTNDCSHVAAAKAMLGKSKFSESTKKKIAACINRRAKQLGCGSEKKTRASKHQFPKLADLSEEEFKLYGSEAFKTTRELLEKSIKNPGMDLDFKGC